MKKVISIILAVLLIFSLFTACEKVENNSFIHNQYSKEQIKSLISNLDEVEV